MKMRTAAAGVALSALLAAASHAGDISREGALLAERLDYIGVESKWLAGSKVDWETGAPVPGDIPGKTHCSAFVAAFCKSMGVYILRPPEHPQARLANAQHDWLETRGAEHSWRPVASPLEAQELANKGLLVVAVFKNPDPSKAGHIVIIRPSAKDRAEIARDGPQAAHVGSKNRASTTLREAFRAHPGAWTSADKHNIKFHAAQPAREASHDDVVQ